MPHLLKREHGSYESYCEDATLEVVRERFAEDFRLLGYDG